MPDATHSQTCYRWHHECAVSRIADVRELCDLRLGHNRDMDDLIEEVLHEIDGGA